MKSLRILAAAVLAAAIALPASAPAAPIAKKGAEVGVWTQDFDAAKKLAVEKKLPLFVNFTGSDWCGWCKLMDRKVFSTDDWSKWAKDKLVLAFIDFPQNPKLVPKEFVQRNKDLQRKYGVRGYPTYVILYTDGETEWGRLGASRDANPKDFIAQVEKVLAEQPAFGPRVRE